MNGAPSNSAASGNAGDVSTARLILAVAAILFVGLRWLALDIPLERDEGEYAYIAQRLLHGEVPYRDAFDQKPPGIFLAYLVPVALFGTSVTAIHGFLALWNAGTAAFVYLITRQFADRRAAAFAVLAFALLSIDPAWLATAANTESFMILPMTAAVWCAMRAVFTRSLRWWFLAGFLSLAACLFKQVAVTNVLFLAVLAVYPQLCGASSPERLRLLHIAMACLTGALSALAPFVIWFVSAGAWSEFADCVLWHNVRYAQNVPVRDGLLFLALQLLEQSHSQIFLWMFAAGTLFDWRAASQRSALFTGAWLICSALGVSAGLYFRAHYFVQLAPVLSMMAGCAAGRLSLLLLRSPTRGQTGGVAALAAFAMIGPYLNAERTLWLAPDGNARSRLIYGSNPFCESAELAARIRAEASPDDRVFIFGSEPQILFLAERRSATRYIFLYPAMMHIPGARDRQWEIVKELQNHPPRVILMTDLQTSLLMHPRTPAVLGDYVDGLVENEYQLTGLRQRVGKGFQLLTDDAARETWRQAVSQPRSDQQVPRIDLRLYVRRTDQ